MVELGLTIFSLLVIYLINKYRKEIGKITKLIDKPDKIRKFHKKITPLLGGIMIFASFILINLYLIFFKELNKTSLIIDAGANIGASTVYFSHIFPNSFIFSIEPDTANWQLLEMNTAGLNGFNFNGAIADTDGELVFEDPGRSDWGFMTKRVGDSDNPKNIKKVKSISPASILAHSESQNTNPLVIKIDIEGGEDALFNGDTSWLGQFPLVIIELHDWMLPFSGSSRNFIKSIAQYDFDFVHKGENIFLFNRELLAPEAIEN